MTDGTEKCNPKIEENQREDRRAFRKFIVLLLVSMVVGGITGAFSTMAAKEQADIGAGITAGLQKIAPYANLVIAAALAVWMTGMLRGGRAEYRRWDGEEEQLIEKIERKLGIGAVSYTHLHHIGKRRCRVRHRICPMGNHESVKIVVVLPNRMNHEFPVRRLHVGAVQI